MGGPHRAAPCGRRYFEYIRSCAIGGERVADHAQRVGNAERLVDDHVFAFEHLVILEEPHHLADNVLRQIAEVLVVGERRVADAHGEQLVVDSLVVPPLHDADGTHVDDRQRLNWLLAKHQHIQRIPIVAEGAGDEPVVRRIVNRAV